MRCCLRVSPPTPPAPRVDNDAAKVIAAGESFSLMPEDEGGFYVPDGMLTVRKTPAGYELFNTNGLWPEAHYSFDMPVAVSADAALVCRLSTASVGASLILFFFGRHTDRRSGGLLLQARSVPRM